MGCKYESKKATTRPPERRGISKSQIRAERRQRAERKKKVRQSIIVSGISVFAILVIASLVVPGLIGTRTTTNIREPLPFNAGGPTKALEDQGNQKNTCRVFSCTIFNKTCYIWTTLGY